MQFRILLKSMLLAGMFATAPANAVTIIHSTTDDPYNSIYSMPDGDYLYYESSYDYYVPGMNTVRLDVQGGMLADHRVSLSWSGGIYVKTNGGVDVQWLHGADNCNTAGVCVAFPSDPPDFLQNVIYGDTFIQFSLNSPKSYNNCAGGALGVCGEKWSYQEIFNAKILGNGPKSFTVTYSSPGDSGSAVPEPTTWAMMIAGFGLVGLTVRRRQSQLVLSS